MFAAYLRQLGEEGLLPANDDVLWRAWMNVIGVLGIADLAPRVLIPEQAAHQFRDDAARLFRLIAAQHSD